MDRRRHHRARRPTTCSTGRKLRAEHVPRQNGGLSSFDVDLRGALSITVFAPDDAAFASSALTGSTTSVTPRNTASSTR